MLYLHSSQGDWREQTKWQTVTKVTVSWLECELASGCKGAKTLSGTVSAHSREAKQQ